jgi:MFS family permease
MAFSTARSSIAVLALCEVGALALWFSTSPVIQSLDAEYGIAPLHKALLTAAVQLGFVIGCIGSALLALPDRYDPRRLFAISAAAAALANAANLLLDPRSPIVPLLRLITGMCMAGIYPVGMKLAASWARGNAGLLVGILVGALTLGSASPYLFDVLGGVNWRITIALASATALAAALAVNLVGIGPAATRRAEFRMADALHGWIDRPMRLANLGYLGHMWELYAMWAWIGAFLAASFALAMPGNAAGAAVAAKLTAFATIGMGALGSLLAGVLADRLGRTTITIAAMAVSGACCLLAGFTFGGAPALTIALCLVWGVTVVADSAQFSASIAELSPPDRVGTMLTAQTALGFLLTLVTIHALPYAVEYLSWRYAFVLLALGPLAGIVAMARLRSLPASRKLAGGRR